MSDTFKHDGPGCCDCSSPTDGSSFHQGDCVVGVCLTDQGTGEPISGASIVFSDSSTPKPKTYACKTDGDGCCFCDATEHKLSGLTSVAISYGNLECHFGPLYCGQTVHFYYCKRTYVFTAVDGDTGGTLGGATITDHYSGGPCVVDEEPGPCCQAGVTVEGGVLTGVTEELTCASADNVNCPTFLCAYGVVNCAFAFMDGYWAGCYCADEDPPCGGTAEFSVVLWPKSKYILDPCCGCDCVGNRSRVIPRKLYASVSAPEPIVGSRSGQSIELDWDPTSWDGDPATYDGGTSIFGTPIPAPSPRWTSGCLPGDGAYGSCLCCNIDNCQNFFLFPPCPPGTTPGCYGDGTFVCDYVDTSHQAFPACEVVLTLKTGGTYFNGPCSDLPGSRMWSIVYSNYWCGDCSDDSLPAGSSCAPNCPDVIYTAPVGFLNGQGCAPAIVHCFGPSSKPADGGAYCSFGASQPTFECGECTYGPPPHGMVGLYPKQVNSSPQVGSILSPTPPNLSVCAEMVYLTCSYTDGVLKSVGHGTFTEICPWTVTFVVTE